jgi:hypothetical protein
MVVLFPGFVNSAALMKASSLGKSFIHDRGKQGLGNLVITVARSSGRLTRQKSVANPPGHEPIPLAQAK